MPVITISREIYSEGSYIGEKVAEALGYHFVDKSMMKKVFTEHSIVQLSEVHNSGPGFWARFDDMRTTTVKFLKQVILALASQNMITHMYNYFMVIIRILREE